MKVSVTIDDVRLKSILKSNQTLIFTEKSFFYTFLEFTKSRSYPLDDIKGFYRIIPGSYQSDKSKVHENPFCTVLLSAPLQVIKYTKNQA